MGQLIFGPAERGSVAVERHGTCLPLAREGDPLQATRPRIREQAGERLRPTVVRLGLDVEGDDDLPDVVVRRGSNPLEILDQSNLDGDGGVVAESVRDVKCELLPVEGIARHVHLGRDRLLQLPAQPFGRREGRAESDEQIGLLVVLLPGALAAASIPPTPNAGDIPTPVPGDSSLAGADRPDIARFLQVRRAEKPSLSPDGSRLAFKSPITGTPQLWAVGTAGGWPRQLTFSESITFHEWSPAGDRILYGTDRGGDEREGYYLLSADGSRERELLAPSGAYRVFGAFSRDGSRIAYATTERNGVDFDVHVLDVETGEDREVHRGEGGLYPVSWRPDGGALILTQTRGEDAHEVFLLDLAGGRLETLFQPADRSGYESFAWKPDSSGFYVVTNQGRDFHGLAWYGTASRDLTYLETPEHDVEAVGLSDDGRMLLWTTNAGGASALHARDLASGEPIATPELPHGIYEIRLAPRAAVASIYVESPRVPGDVWVWQPPALEAHRATHSSTAGLDLARMIVPEHLSFAARDGALIHGLLYLPTDLAPGVKPPLLLAVHGGPTGQSRPDWSGPHQYLLTRGIAVFELNFRGSTGYGKRFARLNDLRLREDEIYDLADAVQWLGRGGRVDSGRAAVMGGSYGGYLTMAAMTRLPGVFSSGVAFVGVANWLTALEGASPQLKASDRLEYGDVDDPEDRGFFRRISPITHIDNVRAPVMVVHGANDPRDPVTESDQFVRAIREQGGEVEYLRFPDEGHSIRKLSNRIIAYRRIAAFLERTLEVEKTPEVGEMKAPSGR